MQEVWKKLFFKINKRKENPYLFSLGNACEEQQYLGNIQLEKNETDQTLLLKARIDRSMKNYFFALIF